MRFVLFLRSLAFNIAFYCNLIVFLCVGAPFFFTPRRWSIRALQVWARVSLWLLGVMCNTRLEIRHPERLKTGPVLIACKHQSLFETFAILPLVDDPAMVLKRELTWIPLYGWFALKFAMITVDRDARASALRRMVAAALKARDNNRQIIIFPEGTRKYPGAPPDYKSGAAALYRALDLPCIPVALNSGLFWPRRQFVRYPGTITMSILPAIEPGLERSAFMARLETAIEHETRGLEHKAAGK